MYLSEHFTLSEVTNSETAARKGIDNTPPSSLNNTLAKTATGLEKVRALLGNVPIHINSWYRCPELNAAIGSTNHSQHLLGEAVDFICPAYGTPFEVCEKILANANLIRYDQLIFEYGWVHISWGAKERRQALTLGKHGTYIQGISYAKSK